MAHLQRISMLMLLALCVLTNAQVQNFPKMSDIFMEFYQTEVVISDEDGDYSALATEYYDGSQGRSVLNIMAIGLRMSYYYYNFTNDILEVNGTACVTSPVDESVEYYEPPFYGWVNRKPFVIGPSALLWFAQDKKVDYIGTKVVRGITCDHFSIGLDAQDDKMEIKYYFAAKDWTTPYKVDGFRVPVRIQLNGVSARGTMGHLFQDQNQVIDFTYFKIVIDDWKNLQVPTGLGCFGRKPDRIMPKLPNAFKFSAQIHDMLKVTEPDAITYERIYFDNSTLLARVDTWSRKQRSSIVYDFGDGVSYNIEGRTKCSIKAIRKGIFVREDEHLMTYLSTPAQILGLTGDFYFMGYTKYRNIPCSAFETAKRNKIYQGKFYYLLVVTVYFTQDYTEVITEAEDLMKVPIYLKITGYDTSNRVTYKTQYNIFGFNDVSDFTIYQNFPIESCFPKVEQRNYFVLVMQPKKEDATLFINEIAKPLARINSVFLQQVRAELVSTLNISDIRVPFLKTEYTMSGIYVSGLLLERPPVLSQFYLWMTPILVRLPRELRLRELANTLEECATACINDQPLCRRFFFCGQTCLTAPVSEDQVTLPPNDLEVHTCKIYHRGFANSNSQQLYLTDAISVLDQAVQARQFQVPVPLNESTEISAVFTDFVVGEGPYVKDIPDKSYKIVAENYQLIPESFIESTIDKTDYETIMDCYQVCKDETSLSCASFSICPNEKNKQCRISSLVVVDADSSSDSIDSAKGCNVYSIMLLEMFTKYEEDVPMIPGGKAYKNVRSAEECAQKCKLYEGFSCRGFEFCKTKKSCSLHHRHALELSKDDFGVGDVGCVHYSAKFMADYIDLGNMKIEDGLFNTETGVSVEQCAKACSEQAASCKSFNFCPESQIGAADSSCTLSSKSPLSKGVDPKNVDRCHLYNKKADIEIEGWEKFKLDKENQDPPKKDNKAGVAIGTLVFGLCVGIAIAVGYSYFRSKRASGDGMAVRFMK